MEDPAASTLSSNDVPDNRALVFLVETSDAKRPLDKDLGGSEQILDHSAVAGSSTAELETAGGNGHIPRNVRVALVAVDTVQPYVCMHSITANDAGAGLAVKWSVGGGATVDATWLQWHTVAATEEELLAHAGDDTFLRTALGPAPQIPTVQGGSSGRRLASWKQQSESKVLEKPNLTSKSQGIRGRVSSLWQQRRRRARLATEAMTTSTKETHTSRPASEVQQGIALWGKASGSAKFGARAKPPSPLPEAVDPLKHPFLAAFSAAVHAPIDFPLTGSGASTSSQSAEEDLLWLVAWAGVDHAFGRQGQGSPSQLGPQSLLSNARSDGSYRRSNPRSIELLPSTQNNAQAAASEDGKPALQPRVVQGRKYWPSDPILVAVHRASGRMRVVQATLSCAFWARAAPVANAITPVVNTERESLPQVLERSSSTTGATTGPSNLSNIPSSGDQKTNTINSDLISAPMFLRAYSLLIIFASGTLLFLAARRCMAPSTSSSSDSVATGKRLDWTRNTNFKVQHV